MKKLATLILAGLALYTTAGAVPSGVTTPAAERDGVLSKCKNRCDEKERSSIVRCKKEDKGHERYGECTRECSDENISCKKECEEDSKH